jgi:aspartate carbamoyltransferase catalytic subunit
VIDLEKPDVLMMLRVQTERMNASFFPSEREYSRIWGLNGERLLRLKDTAIVMHPGPMNRGLEIDAVSADSPKSTVLEQVANGVSVRMAVLFQLMSSERPTND